MRCPSGGQVGKGYTSADFRAVMFRAHVVQVHRLAVSLHHVDHVIFGDGKIKVDLGL